MFAKIEFNIHGIPFTLKYLCAFACSAWNRLNIGDTYRFPPRHRLSQTIIDYTLQLFF